MSLKMIKSAFLVAFLVFAGPCVIADKKIVCYFGSWAAYRPGRGKFEVNDIDPMLCTHMIYTFVGIITDGNVNVLDSWMDLPNGKDGFGKFTRLRESSPGTKAMVAIGGWNEGSVKYSQIAGNPATRATFVKNVVAFLKKYNFDGFDVDWEYPNQRGGKPSDKENYVALLKELREEFDKHGFILSIAVAAAEGSASKSYHISQISKYVHFINLMAYDFNGSWNRFTGMNAPLYPSARDTGDQAKLNVDAAVHYWLSQGASTDKIILGIPTYGRSFTLVNPSNTDVGAPANGPGTAGPYTREAGMLGYNEICEYLRQGWSVKRSKEHGVPYAFKGNQWVGYDDVTSVREKANYINSKGLGGAMLWSVETDDFSGSCGDNYPLLSALNIVLRGVTPAPAPPNRPKPDVTLPPPSSSLCKQEGFVRDQKDCSTFYQCQLVNNEYVAHKFRCGAGLVFDPSIVACNYKYLVSGC
ncbi:chitinase-3-like protein 1 isoform X1 [Osmia lignaria lignaria]|uniref:chitinase-3-like protein 1 isoform X1 n=2 Tax=Osmia lignaria lignaria TaxID=1437193 RepID=UPI00402BA71E